MASVVSSPLLARSRLIRNVQSQKIDHTRPQVETIIPVIPVRNLPKSLAFYTEILGFRRDWGGDEGDGICSVSRDQHCLMLREQETGGTPSWIWIGLEDDTLFEEYRSKGVTVSQEPQNHPWAYEMKFEDLDGNVLWLGTEPRLDQPFHQEGTV